MRSQLAPRTVIEAFLPFDGSVGLAAVYDSANEVGLGDQPVRLALRRLVASGDIEHRGRGRAGSIALTDTGMRRLATERIALQLAFDQDSGRAPWDGLWHLLALSAPESERGIRDAFRRQMVGLGAAPVSTGLWLTPHDLSPLLDEGVDSHLVTAAAAAVDVRGRTDPLQIVEALWPAAPILRCYDLLEAAIAADDVQRSPLARQLLLADALESSLRDDPLIPNELRAQPWRPAELRCRWLECWRDAQGAEQSSGVYQGWLPE